jgi:hypothetical protein
MRRSHTISTILYGFSFTTHVQGKRTSAACLSGDVGKVWRDCCGGVHPVKRSNVEAVKMEGWMESGSCDGAGTLNFLHTL